MNILIDKDKIFLKQILDFEETSTHIYDLAEDIGYQKDMYALVDVTNIEGFEPLKSVYDGEKLVIKDQEPTTKEQLIERSLTLIEDLLNQIKSL